MSRLSTTAVVFTLNFLNTESSFGHSKYTHFAPHDSHFATFLGNFDITFLRIIELGARQLINMPAKRFKNLTQPPSLRREPYYLPVERSRECSAGRGQDLVDLVERVRRTEERKVKQAKRKCKTKTVVWKMIEVVRGDEGNCCHQDLLSENPEIIGTGALLIFDT
jgi:hypothetical protein